jgi:hypothetical protein
MSLKLCDSCTAANHTERTACWQCGGLFAAPTGLEAQHTTITKMKTGTELIAEERARQINSEGWSEGHDDSHEYGELARASVAYTLHTLIGCYDKKPAEIWPWELKWWKPAADPVRNLVKAGALIAAEIDRLQRASNGEVSEPGGPLRPNSKQT